MRFNRLEMPRPGQLIKLAVYYRLTDEGTTKIGGLCRVNLKAVPGEDDEDGIDIEMRHVSACDTDSIPFWPWVYENGCVKHSTVEHGTVLMLVDCMKGEWEGVGVFLLEDRLMELELKYVEEV